VTFLKYAAQKCGDVYFAPLEQKYFSSLEDARKNKEKASCYKKPKYGNHGVVGFFFSYQKGKWVFKEVSSPKGNPYPEISSALSGNPSLGRMPLTDNDHWRKLIE